ncbi:hypothetical protein P3S67_030606 [Capsicum chacoense]
MEIVESKVSPATCSNNLTVSSNDNRFSPARLMIDRSFEEKVVEVKSQPPGLTNSSSDECKRENQGVGLTNLGEILIARNGDAECVSSKSDHFHSVDWIDNVLQVADEKQYYQCSRCNGFINNVQEYVVIRFEDERLIPSKLPNY